MSCPWAEKGCEYYIPGGCQLPEGARCPKISPVSRTISKTSEELEAAEASLNQARQTAAALNKNKDPHDDRVKMGLYGKNSPGTFKTTMRPTEDDALDDVGS